MWGEEWFALDLCTLVLRRVLSVIVHLEPASCFGIMGKGQHINIEGNLRVLAGRPVGFLPPFFDIHKSHDSNCDFCTATVWKNSDRYRLLRVFTEGFRIRAWNLLVSELVGLS